MTKKESRTIQAECLSGGFWSATIQDSVDSFVYGAFNDGTVEPNEEDCLRSNGLSVRCVARQ
ncbi:hypothetical protein IKF21_02435 [Candidatus Saccharibacteria bacterium]|nr:hypothetical protein [Candidatus Saccharibacteria bacterium]